MSEPVNLGDVVGVSLESEPTPGYAALLQDVVVYLELKDGRRVELIRALRTGEGIISHSITRLGIEMTLEGKR